jgi:hypothetical protein
MATTLRQLAKGPTGVLQSAMSKNKDNPKPASGSSNCSIKQGLIPCSLLQGHSFYHDFKPDLAKS